MSEQSGRLGILLMVAATLVFAAQDGISRHLADNYNVFMVVMIRYWFFAAFVIAIASRKAGGVMAAARTTQPVLQITRGALLALEICVTVESFVLLGLIETHVIFATYPLMVAALAGPILGEKAGWRRQVAIAAGFVGVLIILRPGMTVFRPTLVVPLVAALMFAVYGILTRYVARKDRTETSFFWTGTTGAVVMTVVGVRFWQPMSPPDWAWMACLCVTGALGHWLLIRAYEAAEASTVQPFAYFQLVFASAIGFFVFLEPLRWNAVAGGVLIVGAGLFTFWREQVARRRAVSPPS